MQCIKRIEVPVGKYGGEPYYIKTIVVDEDLTGEENN